MNRFTKHAAALAVAIAIVPLPAVAQSSLERVEELTRLGRSEEARVALMEWWDGDRENASRRALQRGFWLRGRLTVDPLLAELDFQRLAILYPSGQFTAAAILRLAQSSFAMGDETAARQYVATLVRDYPRSEAREKGEAWLNTAGPVPPPGDIPTQAVQDSDAGDPPQAVDSAATTPRPAPPRQSPDSVEEETPVPVMNYYVQLGAFADESRAFALYEQVREAGVEVRVVRVEGSRFLHVRFGRFAVRADAVEELEALTAAGISAALVRDDRAEEIVRN